MSSLHFKLAGPLSAWSPAAVSVEALDLELQPAARGVADAALEVEPGRYIAVARLPTGETISAEVHVAPEQEATVVLGTAPAQRTIPAAAARSTIEESAVIVAEHGLRVYVRGEGIGSYVPNKELVGPKIARLEGSVCVSYPEDTVDLIHVDAPGRSSANIVIPSVEGYPGVDLRLALNERQELEVRPRLHHRDADAMLEYSANALLSDAANVLVDGGARAERLLQEKTTDPLAAAAGAYVLLRLGELTRLHDWTHNLYAWFGSLPDGAAIRAEHLAREGHHDEAMVHLMELQARGLPAFSDGLAYAVRRLQLYAATGVGGAPARELLDELVPYSLATDFRQTYTTFLAGEPNDPRRGSDATSTGAPAEQLSLSEHEEEARLAMLSG
jgi:hypothetical protein